MVIFFIGINILTGILHTLFRMPHLPLCCRHWFQSRHRTSSKMCNADREEDWVQTGWKTGTRQGGGLGPGREEDWVQTGGRNWSRQGDWVQEGDWVQTGRRIGSRQGDAGSNQAA